MRSRFGILVAGIAWVLAIGWGLRLAIGYDATPGASANPPPHWPAESQISLATATPTLLMIAHPHCPCTRASLGELAQLVARCPGRVEAHVIFVKPDGASEDWDHSDLRKTAAAIPGVILHDDAGGIEARRFAVETSGDVLLYNPAGALIFNGGITLSRGHTGDNAGLDAIASLLHTGTARRDRTCVFGCPLFATSPLPRS